MTLFFDFDGTLVDISEKYHTVYCDFVQHHGGSCLSQELYWNLKRNAVSPLVILKKSGLESTEPMLLQEFMKTHIELERAVKRDSVFPGTTETLGALTPHHECYLISMRKDLQMLRKQLKDLKLERYFRAVLAVGDTAEPDVTRATPKAQALASVSYARPAMIVGDSEMDINTGAALSIVTCALTTGIRERSVLEQHHPSFILETLQELPDTIHKVTSNRENSIC